MYVYIYIIFNKRSLSRTRLLNKPQHKLTAPFEDLTSRSQIDDVEAWLDTPKLFKKNEYTNTYLFQQMI
ncbi:hypothetical protein HanHA89_Chr11g0407011 [Helianthus annuus]|nr:hypothetical protein HanHA89_Chr11g0407011 [Helianthus annuus]